MLHGGTVSPRPASGGVAGVGFRRLHSGSAEQRAFDLPDPSGTGIYQDRCASWPGSPCASAVWPGRVSLNGCKGIYQQESFLNATAFLAGNRSTSHIWPVWPAWGHCTIRRFHGPDPVGNPVWPVLVGAWRPRGSYFGKTSVWPTMHSGSGNNEGGSSS